ncbi:MAG: selenide, water dikinase SelD [Parasynechococcus sp.]|uniref:selenide, water dikinase SelD n=1 Tax=Parasynechococcus sp. TaxID=3101203 RepID=UPI0038899993
MTPSGPLLLAGGGHSHALLLKRWAMTPQLRPKRGVVLVNRHPTALYSGMVPGLIAGIYRRDELSINLPHLCDRAGVAFVQAEIVGVDSQRQDLLLHQRPALSFGVLSLDVGAVTRNLEHLSGVPIKPLEEALQFLSQQDPEDPQPFRIVGAGPAGIEVALALRRRWPHRALELQIRAGQLNATTKSILRRAHIHCVTDASAHASLLCTGSRAPSWLANSGFAVDHNGRVLTNSFLQLEGYSHLFASGDCAVMEAQPRPASGVWAVRSAVPLAQNLEAICNGQNLKRWTPQRQALQLIGTHNNAAWMQRGRARTGPFPLLWALKQRIDRSFMAGFSQQASMQATEPMACRGCAAKLSARPLNAALSQAGLKTQAEDAANLGGTPALLQSVDGFPALVSDPWLNGRLTTLHACSDLWACGAKVTSAMAVVTLPSIHPTEQQELLHQTLAGVQSVLIEQGASLIGGHTLESRSPTPSPTTLGLQVALTVNGQTSRPWPKGGIQPGDALLLSRPLGVGVLFAAAMAGVAKPKDVETTLRTMNQSQHQLVDALQKHGADIHACTDVTGFGLLGHLGEMLQGSKSITIQLWADRIPAHPGALDLLDQGLASSLAPANRDAWSLLEGPVQLNASPSQASLELLVDPQTCGPLLVACTAASAERLMAQDSAWIQVGIAGSGHG